MGDTRKPDDAPREKDSDLTKDLPSRDGTDDVKGGWGSPKVPAPGVPGGIPIPYPNLPK